MTQSMLSVAEQVLHGTCIPGTGVSETLIRRETPSQDKDHCRQEILGSTPEIAA